MRAVLISTLLAIACGSAPPAPGTPAAAAAAQKPSNLPPLPRSSIAAVLLHREELGLDDDQVHEMQQIDEILAETNARLTDDGEHHARPDGGPPPARGGGSGLSIGPGVGGRRGGGGGRGGGRHMSAPPPERAAASIEQRMEDNDTRAYLKAEQVLNDAQREKAREYAEEFREQLYDRRHGAEQ